jgi:L-alanine-DL-glutamate epimerase-like enolase superfamily enzyme
VRAFERLGGLPLEIDRYELEPLQRDVASAFTRRTTVVHLIGGGEEGLGEDVTYDAEAHEALQAAGPVLGLQGAHTLASFSSRLDGVDLFADGAPTMDVFRSYRRWAFESAALDLALRQSGLSLADAVGLTPLAVTFVVSLRLGEPATIDPVRRRLDLYPGLRFKLDPTSSWTDELVRELAATGAVDSVDFKGFYRGTIVDQPADPELYRRVAEGFPTAWLEDPAPTPETDAVLGPHRDRVTWDEPIHSAEDIAGLRYKPRLVNIKPSRFGTLAGLLAAYEYCDAEGIRPYGGGQFELGPGRGQIQYLASLFHPDTPNDVAPVGYNEPEPRPGLPESPLQPAGEPTGFRWTT